MIKNRSGILALFSALLILSLACLAGSGQSAEEEQSAAIATSVQATLDADQEAAYPTVHPTVTAGPPPANYNVNGVSFFYNPTLAEQITAGITPGITDQDMPWQTPDHREYRFNGWPLGHANLPPAIWVFPVDEFRAVNEYVGPRLDALQLALDTQPADHFGLEVVSIFGAGQFFQSNVRYLDFQNGRGARWLSQYGQALFPIGQPQLFYTFQGLTDNGAYYVSIILPVHHPDLPDADEVELNDDFYANYDDYREEVEVQLNAQPDASFLPSLDMLDEIATSLLVESP